MKYKSSGEPSMFAVSFCLSFNTASIMFCGSLRVVSSVRINEGGLLAKHLKDAEGESIGAALTIGGVG